MSDVMENDELVDEAQEQAETPAELKKRAAAEKKAEKAAEKERKAEERAAAKAAKDEAKAASKVKAPGVISTMIEVLTDGEKHTVDDIYGELAERLPGRGEQMKTTIRIQLVRLHQQGRLVVHSEDRHAEDGKRITGKLYWADPVEAS